MQIKIYDEEDNFEVDTLKMSSYDHEDEDDMKRLADLIAEIISDYELSKQDL